MVAAPGPGVGGFWECGRFEGAPETLQRIAQVGASVMVAIYPPESDEPATEG